MVPSVVLVLRSKIRLRTRGAENKGITSIVNPSTVVVLLKRKNQYRELESPHENANPIQRHPKAFNFENFKSALKNVFQE